MSCNPQSQIQTAVIDDTLTLAPITTSTALPNELIPTSTPALPTSTPMSGCVELLRQPWHLEGTGPQEAYEHDTDPNGLVGKSIIRITYDLHRLSALPDDASALIFDQPFGGAWHYVSLSNYGQNGFDGLQTVDIPLSAFSGLDLNVPIGTLHTRFWHTDNYAIDVSSIMACN